MKKIFTLLSFAALSICSTVTNGQTNRAGRPTSASQFSTSSNRALPTAQWQRVPEGMAPSPSIQRIKPERFLVYRLDETALRLQLFSLSTDPAEGTIISLPMPDGSYREFRVWATPMLNGRLAERYPDIKTFTAEAVNDRRITAKLDFTLFGFHAMVFEQGNTSFIDPFDIYRDGYYVVHYKKDELRHFANRMKCEVKAPEESVAGNAPTHFDTRGQLPALSRVPGSHPAPQAPYAAARTANGWTMRTYDIGLSANSFYCQAATGLPSPTIAQALSAMTTTMNRVNGVYNRELSVQMNFTSQEDTLIWPTATGSINGADPFAAINSNPGSCLSTNQTVCDARLTGAGIPYDIGHVFTTGAGGLAGVGVVCNNTQKARGVTGSPSPVGDGYDIDYVAHEIGHEFGSNHTFNNNQDGSCSGNAASAVAYEPGSGATIMDYAGICTPDDLQPHSDPYFSASSLQQITTALNATETVCATTASSGHDTGHLTLFSATYNVPYKTPFELTGPTATATGSDTAVTYQWFQWNLGQIGLDFGNRLNQASIKAPNFRSFQPVYTPYRCFPKITMVLAGVLSDAGTDNNEGEKAADTARYMTFKMALRNIIAGKGCINIPDDSIHVNFSSTGAANGYAGFKVTSQGTTGITYAGGSTQTVTWNVVGTNAAPVSASNVDIYMSVDGGYTWPYTIGTFPNTGTASVTIPNPAVTSSTSRIKVKGTGNIFFNINSNNFTVTAVAVTAPITGTFTVCAGFTTTLADATPGGTWSSSTPSVATVNSSGVVTGVAGGTSTITYTASGGPVTAVVTVNTIPSVGSITGTASVCIGQTVTLSNSTSGGVWSSTNTAVATVNTSGVVSGITAGTATISYVVTNACGTGGATRVVTVSAPSAVAPITGTATVCSGLTTTLSDVTPSGTWSSGDVTIATVSSSGVVSGVAAGTVTISYNVTNGAGCVSSATTVVTVNATPSGVIIPSGTIAVCTGGYATLTASSGTGFTYQWQLGGSPISGATNSTYNAGAAGSYNVIINTPAGCSVTSSSVTITVSPGVVVVPSVNITTSTAGTTFCGTAPLITFTANPVNGGTAPVYQWFVNGTPVGTSTSTYAYVPANGDNITVQMTSNAPCASPTIVMSSAVGITVNPMVTPSVTISASPNDSVCVGQPVTYTAVVTYSGTAPTFLWQENGINVATGPTYTATTPHNGDIIVCTMTSNLGCVTASTVTSPAFVMHVLSPVTNTIVVTASATEVTAGSTVSFIASAPYATTYQWFVNGTPVAGATSTIFTTTTLSNGDIVTCAAVSDMLCASPHVAISGGLTMHVTSGIKDVTFGGFSIVPNPNKGTFQVMGETAGTPNGTVAVNLINMLGQTVYKGSVEVKNNKVNQQIVLDESLSNGMYLIKLTAESDYVVFHVLLER